MPHAGRVLARMEGVLAVALATWMSVPARLATAAEPPDSLVVHVAPERGDVWSEPQHRRYHGRIVQFDADALVYEDVNGQRQRVPSEQVESVTVQWRSEQAAVARTLVEQRKFREAIGELEAAIKSGIPRWQQRLLIADLVRCLDAIGSPRTAGIIFLDLAASRPPLMLYADMPLCWTTREPDPVLLEQVEQWFAAEDPHAQLLAASWLLSGARRSEAASVLQRLRGSSVRGVALMATLQAWRATPPVDTQRQLQRWFDMRDALPRPLQLGPTEWLGERLEQVGKPELAVGQWMRIVSQHQDRYHRWRTAAERAVELMRRLGHQDEVKRLTEWIDEESSSRQR